MLRIAAVVLLVSAILQRSFIESLAFSQVDPKSKPPSAEEIRKAITDLGSSRFPVRDRASKLLWQAGEAAEPALREAARNPDEEISQRAKLILDKFDWGIYPSTPEKILEQIERFKGGMSDQRQEAIGELMKFQPLPFATLRKLLAKEEDPEAREQMFARMSGQVREAIPGVLRRGDIDTAQELIELSLVGAPLPSAAQDYAAFMLLRGKLDEAITRFEKQLTAKGKDQKRTAEILIFLYRTRGDWKKAREAAEKAENPDLVEEVLWEAGEWKELAMLDKNLGLGNPLGVRAAYARLAGDTKKFEALIDDIKRDAEDDVADPIRIRQAADALLLNRRADDAIEILTAKKLDLARVFDLLCTQMKYKEAFDLVDEARRRDTDPAERRGIEIRRARMLYLLGEKEAAVQLFRKIADEVKGREDLFLTRQLLRSETRVGLNDLALEHAGQCLAALNKAGQNSGLTPIFEAVFGEDNQLLAQTWWKLMRLDIPDENPALAMKRIRDLMTGKLDKKSFDDWTGKMFKLVEKDRIRGEEERLVHGKQEWLAWLCLAEAYRMVGNEKKVEECFTKAGDAAPIAFVWLRYGDYLMSKKRYSDAAKIFEKAAQTAQNNPFGLIELDPDTVEENPPSGDIALATYLQGRALLLGGDEEGGKRLIEVAHWLPLGDVQARARLVDELSKRDWPEMARKEAELLVKAGWYQHFTVGNVLSYLARVALKEKDFDKAARYYERGVIGCMRTGATYVESAAYLIVPESIRVYHARALLAKKQLDTALTEIKTNLQLMPGNVDAAIRLVPELEKVGKQKDADEVYSTVKNAYTKLLKEYPNSAFARNSIAWVMANCRRDLDEALKHSEKAVELEPKLAGYLDTLAEVHFRKGNRAKALEFMKRCAEMEPKNAYYKKQLIRFEKEAFDSPTPDEEEAD